MTWRLLAVVLLVSVLPRAAEGATRRVAIIVGNNVGSGATETLRHAESDAEKVYDVLVDLGGFAAEDIILLTGDGGDVLRGAFDTVETRIEALKASGVDHTMLLFYYSGHAEPTHLELGASRFPMAELRARLQSSGADMRLGILDACHSGAILREKGGRRTDTFPLGVEDTSGSTGYAILTSSAASEASQESDELRGAFFTSTLVSGLRGDADYTGDRRVTLGELYQYAYHATLKRSEATVGGRQHPHFESAQNGDVVLSHLERAPALLTLPEESEGSYLIWDPSSDTVLAEVLKKRGTRRSIAVRASELDVYERSDDRLRHVRVDVGTNEEVVIQPDALEDIARADYALRRPGFAVSLAAGFGAQTFYDEAFTSGYVNDTLLYGVDVRLHNLGVPGLDLGIEGLFTVSDQTITLATGPTDQSLFEAMVDATLFYRFQIQDFHVALGPRVAWVMFRRRVDPPSAEVAPAADPVQFYNTFTPGAAVEVGYRIIPELTVGANISASWLHFEADGDELDLLTMNWLIRMQVNF